MTTDIPAGRELDAALAERVMGLRVVHPAWPCGYYPDGCSIEIMHAADDENREPDSWHTELRPIHQVREGDPDNSDTHTYRFLCEVVPAYSTDIAAAWLVVERMRALGWCVAINDRMDDPEPWWCEFATDGYERGAQAWANTMPLAVCRAALAATR